MASNCQLNAIVRHFEREVAGALYGPNDPAPVDPAERNADAKARADRITEALLGAGRAVAAALDAEQAEARAAERAKIEAAVLPECDGFKGTGRRCAECKIHKNIHD